MSELTLSLGPTDNLPSMLTKHQVFIKIHKLLVKKLPDYN